MGKWLSDIKTESIVKIIQGLIDFKVDIEYVDFCSPSFGVGEQITEILTYEELNQSMFEPCEFLTKEHLGLFHITLPTQFHVSDASYDFFRNYYEEHEIVFKSRDELVIFAILHEFGHAYDLFVTRSGDVEGYVQDTLNDKLKYDCEVKLDALSFVEASKRYRSLSAEILADEFALKYYPTALKLVSKEIK